MSSHVSCTLCGATDGRKLFRTPERRFDMGGAFALVRCAGCGLVRTEPQPNDLGSFYPSGYYSFVPPTSPGGLASARLRRQYGLPVDGSPARRVLAGVGISRLSPGLPPGPPGRLLDVGCGSGDMMAGLSDVGWQCTGVEVSEEAVGAARMAGLDVRLGDLHAADFGDASFDVVRFWHALEHVRSPRAELTEARRVLRSGGLVLIGVPNFGSLLSRVAREQWFYLDVPRHLWHFERRTLERLLTETGFRVEDVRLVSTSSPILGTVDFLRGRDGVLASKRAFWLGTLPLAALLDVLGLGDALEACALAI
jgi:SAM-dependent methyltransferase